MSLGSESGLEVGVRFGSWWPLLLLLLLLLVSSS